MIKAALRAFLLYLIIVFTLLSSPGFFQAQAAEDYSDLPPEVKRKLPFGVNLGGEFFKQGKRRQRIPTSEYGSVIRLLDKAGVGWVRIFIDWDVFQPQNGEQWDSHEWEYYSQLLTILGRKDFNIDLIVGSPPAWASLSSASPNFSPPQNMNDWENFLNKLTQELETLGVKVAAWEIENEVDSKEGYQHNPDKYLDLYQSAVKVLSSKDNVNLDGQATILPSSFVTMALVDDQSDTRKELLSYWLNNLNPESVSAVNLHYYGTNSDFDGTIDVFKQLVATSPLAQKPLWLTETNLNRTPSGDIPQNSELKMQGRYKLAFDNGFEKVFWLSQANSFWGPGLLIHQQPNTEPYFEKNTTIYKTFQKIVKQYLLKNGLIEPDGLLGDVNNDGKVNIVDVSMVIARFLQGGDSQADVNGDGVVDIIDYSVVVKNFAL